MSLRTAMASLPDDRGTVFAAREIVACFASHVGEALDASRIARATGLDPVRITPVLEALARGVVIDCDGIPALDACTYQPDAVLRLEVERYLRSRGPTTTLQSNIGKFQSRLGRG